MNEKKYNWIKISDAIDSPAQILFGEDIRLIEVNGKNICITEYNGNLYAFDRRCPHAGAMLEYGWINDQGHIVCHHHQYAFDMQNGKNTSGEGFYLQTYPVKLNEEGVFIGFERKGFLSWF